MAWGGSRVGSGRKPKRDTPLQVVDARESFSSGDSALRTPPADLPEAQRPIWTKYASLAIEQRTLVAATVPAFALLCELQAKKVEAEQTAARGGVSEMRVYLQLAKQVETVMARFRLAPFGKAIAPASAAKPSTNPAGRYLDALSGRKKA